MNNYKQEYRKIKQRIFSTKNPVSGISSFFYSEDISTLKKIANSICKDRLFEKIIVGNCFPGSIEEMENCGNMPWFTELERSVIWTTLSISQKSNEINEFLEYRNQFDTAFLNSNFDACEDILNKVHNRFGFSIWEISNRIYVLNEKDGLDAQKRYAQLVKSKLKQGFVPNYLVSCISKQCERNVSVLTYLRDLQIEYNQFTESVGNELSNYAKFLAGGFFLSSESELDFINESNLTLFLFLNDKLSLIDRYLYFVRIVDVVYKSSNKLIEVLFFDSIITISKKIRDPFFKNIEFELEHDYCMFHPDNNDEICNAFDLYTKGEYSECNALTTSLINNDIKFFPLIELLAKCNTYLSRPETNVTSKTVLQNLLFKLQQLFSRQGDIREIQLDLIKTIYIHLDSPWAINILHIINKCNNRLVVLEPISFDYFFNSITTPDCIFSFDTKELLPFLESTSENFRRSLTTQFVIAVRTQDITKVKQLPIDEIRRKKYLASLLIETEPQEALEIITEIPRDFSISHIVQEFNALKIKAYLELNLLEDAMKTFVSSFEDNQNFIHIGFISQIFEMIKKGEHNSSSSILTPLVCSYYFNYYPNHNDNDEIVLNICYEEFLESQNVSKPSELLNTFDIGDDSMAYIRFLSNVCIPTVMDRSLSFESNDDVLRERILICEALIKIDPDYSSRYFDEINRLTKTLLVRLAKREVENGKIYIDIEGIRNTLAKELSESYERYQDYRNNAISETLAKLVKALNDKEDKPQILYTHINNESMLKSIATRSRDVFVADNKYGLDGCLSVRIRHGTLESQLRSCFEKHKLITTRTNSGVYKDNLHWMISSLAEGHVKSEIQSIFSTFSKRIDDVIANLKNNLIQIKTEDRNPEGLFEFSVDDHFIALLNAKMNHNDTFDGFLTGVIEILTTLTNSSLDRVQNALGDTINGDFQQALKELEEGVSRYSSDLKIQELRARIAATRTDISTELSNIAEWFKLAQNNTITQYSLALAATLSSNIIKYAHSNCNFTSDESDIDPNIVLIGSSLKNVVEVFKILFGNVIEHSGQSSRPIAIVHIHKKGTLVSITVENKVASNNINSKKLQEIESSLKDWETQGRINTEGGSGLHKIKKILSVDMRCENTIHLAYHEDTFVAEVVADMKEMFYETTDN